MIFIRYSTGLVSDWIGCVLGCGIMGALGINCAHELLHKRNPYERGLAQISLLCSAYLHFMNEHTIGHHNRVATPEDPATSRYGETFYQFWPRTVFGGFSSAWHLEKERLSKAGLPLWSYHNLMISWLASPVLLAASILFFLGPSAAIFYIVQAVIGFSHLEAVNYIEHYGLVRGKIGDGLYEIVSPLHSWNAPFTITNFFLFKLQRHSDHHAYPTRRYQILRSFPESPQLPTGYAGMVVLSLIPPLFFRVMNPLVDNVRAQYKMELQSAKNM
jgi:alkane 1-monooxygenase